MTRRIVLVLAAFALTLTGAYGCNIFSVTSATGHVGGLVQIKGVLTLDPDEAAAGAEATIDLGNLLLFEGPTGGCLLAPVSDSMGSTINQVSVSADHHRARFIVVNLDGWQAPPTPTPVDGQPTPTPAPVVVDLVFCNVRIPSNAPTGNYPVKVTSSELSDRLGQQMQLSPADGGIYVLP